MRCLFSSISNLEQLLLCAIGYAIMKDLTGVKAFIDFNFQIKNLLASDAKIHWQYDAMA
eukprot:c34975_g1_i1 orf=120-296(-)